MADSDSTPSDPPVVVDPLSSSEEHEMKIILVLEEVEELLIEISTETQALRKAVERCWKFRAQMSAYFQNLRKVAERTSARLEKENRELENRCKMIEQEIAAKEEVIAAGLLIASPNSSTNEARKRRVAIVLVEDDEEEVQTPESPPIKARKVDVIQTPPVPASPPAGEEEE